MPTRGQGFDKLEALKTVFAYGNRLPHTDYWMKDGIVFDQVRLVEKFPVLYAGNGILPGLSLGENNWNSYQIKTRVRPDFSSVEDIWHFGVAVLHNQEDFLYIMVRKTGLSARFHNANGWVGSSEILLKSFVVPLANKDKEYRFNIDVWDGRVNVSWEGEFLPTINVRDYGYPRREGKILVFNYPGMPGVVFPEFRVIGLQPVVSGTAFDIFDLRTLLSGFSSIFNLNILFGQFGN